MIEVARRQCDQEQAIRDRISYVCGVLPEQLPTRPYEAIISTNFLHHLHNPAVLWNAIKRFSRSGTRIFVADLFRPGTEKAAQQLVDTYAAGEPTVLQKDFFNSFLAAFEPQEVVEQLQRAGLEELRVKVVSDRHLIVSGQIECCRDSRGGSQEL